MASAKARHLIHSGVIWMVVTLALVVGATPVLAPVVARRAGVPAEVIDRAIGHVEAIANEPHPMGSPQSERVRSYLLGTLAEAGLLPQTQQAIAPDYYGLPGRTVEIVNVLARIPGTGPHDQAIVLIAHYDTVPETPGANDNSAAVAALLEVAGLLANDPPATDVILLFSDGEEPTPRFGASAFVDEHPWFDDVFLAVNLEGIGVAGPALLVEVQGPDDELVARLADASSAVAAFSFLTATTDLIGGASTDFDVFRNAGVPGYSYAYARGSSIYHTPRDDIASLNVDGMTHQISLAVATARGLGAPVVGGDHGDSVFFSLPFGIVASYGATFAYLSVLVSLVVAGLAVGRWRRSAPLRRTMAGAGSAAAMTVAVIVVGAGLWVLVTSLRPTMGVVESYAYLAGLIALAGVGWVFVSRRAMHTEADLVGGVLALWMVMAAVLGLTIPGIGYLFVVPLVFAATALLFARSGRGFAQRVLVVAVVAFASLAVAVPAIDTFFQFATPRPGNPDSELPFTIVVPLFIAFATIGLIASAHRATVE